ncbi:hypothetical protein CVT26_011803 [Gymnopilus dilepis]|uniref:Uncharacterized protein n=1 Tax=Gymnopilus dilepis TaxID=231916 RepID=A0A409X293_9AGAR|nr:hypothetical protein CVT26_011803 [Gymnopilus dilepis]
MVSNPHDMIEAHVEGICLIATANRASGNPGEDALSPCAQAKRRPFCSNCQAYPSLNVSSATSLPPPLPSIAFAEPNTDITPAAAAAPLTKKTRAMFAQWLNGFAIQTWNSKDDIYATFLPYTALWHGISQEYILDNFHNLRTRESVDAICADWKYLESEMSH